MKILTLLLAIGSFAFTGNVNNSGKDVINNLEKLGYFKYTAPARVAELKAEMIKGYDSYKILSTITDDETLLPFDYRMYFCDGEALFEIGGLEEYLTYAKHAFERRGLKLEWSNIISEEKGKNWNHRITVNGKEYVAFSGRTDRMNVWGLAQLNFYRLVNDQLELQGSDDRLYPISGGEDGQFVFLSKELFNYISATFYHGKEFRKWDIIYPVEEWKEVHGL